MTSACTVSVVIKALNEEKRIETAVKSALMAVGEVGGEVILADSCSSDRTVELAAQHPITIVQLAHPSERCCGAGPQMGYQHANGEFVYILDGDMKMLPGFLGAAVAFMRAHPDVVGVAGLVVEMNTQSLEYIARMERASGHMQPGEVDRLDMGGLYRREAVVRAGYFSDRNLHSYEEFDLAVRLRAQGGRLWRLDQASVQHHGHDAPPYQLLKRRWQSKYICGLGELVRGAWGRPHFALAVLGVSELKLYVAVMFWWLTLVMWAAMPLPSSAKLGGLVLLAFLPFAAMAWRKRSMGKAVYSVTSWTANTLGLLRGLMRTRISPTTPLETVTVKRGITLQATPGHE
jgi:glycosyltransferase involved in cell wall biosynthesis